ncbi:hypothetical protein amb1095 [Paramagnetospirillum magneticum AMB-1]|uniref:Uncharacterized protein n=1 Tax=Paramagnetospirillum magneticum (strain ATCC 700264 / AMB-1) TaxID=342108 RepID=Q2W8C6_PARM1|nr:hypothetical protein amb1095 [Paramagnetospirillum magneticum AMB-1]
MPIDNATPRWKTRMEATRASEFLDRNRFRQAAVVAARVQ